MGTLRDDWGLCVHHPDPEQELRFAPYWSGCWGTLRGTGSGSQAAEAVHSAWERQLHALGGKAPLSSALAAMQKLYHTWQSPAAYHWGRTDLLSLQPPDCVPLLLHGPTLARVGHSTAVDLHDAAPTQQTHWVQRSAANACAVVMAASVACAPLCEHRAAAALEVSALHGAALRERPLSMGILESRAGSHVLRLSALQAHFQRQAIIWAEPGSSMRCSCRGWSAHGVCEHTIYAEGLHLPGRPATRSFASLPKVRKGGRPRGSTTVPRGAQAAKRRAPSTHTRVPQTKARKGSQPSEATSM